MGYALTSADHGTRDSDVRTARPEGEEVEQDHVVDRAVAGGDLQPGYRLAVVLLDELVEFVRKVPFIGGEISERPRDGPVFLTKLKTMDLFELIRAQEVACFVLDERRR
jgi:hypothetical protein